MIASPLDPALWRGVGPWLRAIASGMTLGVGIVLAQSVGLWSGLAALGSALTRSFGPVWIPMLALALRVGWLWARALRTRSGHGALGRSARHELERIAPIFLALGLVGTIWALDVALGALDRTSLLERWPELLRGLGIALMPTGTGAACQITTRWIAACAPVWSLARVTRSGERELYRLDGVLLGEGATGLVALLASIDKRRPEALHLDLDPLLARERSASLQARISRGVDGPLALYPPAGVLRGLSDADSSWRRGPKPEIA